MYKFNSQSKGSGETFEVVLSGGSPWGFTLQGGSEFRTKLSVLKITPGGKADLSQALAVGDEIVAINGIECQSRAEAIELVRCSRQKLKIALRREGGVAPVNQSNGAVIKKKSDVPNLYKTASELLSSSDFYSTFNVDKQKFAEITQNKKPSNIYDSTDNLSASHENLLESYRQAEIQPNISNSSIMEETSERLSRSSTEIANGRTSPAETDGLSGVSLPEGHWPVMHQRTYTSPGRIQKVMVKSTNIAVSPTGRENDNQQIARSSVNSKKSDDWVGRWLMESHQHVPQPSVPVNTLNTGPGNLDYKDIPDRRISLQERPDMNKSQSLPRSKSFGGPTSYGVTVTATAVKWNDSNNTMNHPRAPQRYSSSNLMQEKQLRDTRPDDPSLRQSEKPWNSLVYPTPGDTVEVRLPRDLKMTTSESTSSLDSVGTMDSSVGGARRQGPAPPPRKSVSKLLSSFRTTGRRRIPEEVQQIPERAAPVSRIPEIAADQPKHSVSRSWPTDHVAESKPAGSDVASRQSWHAEPAVMPDYNRRQANSSTSSTSSDVTPERKLSKSSSLRYSSSVVIRNMRSSSSSSMDEKSSGPTVYRSGQVAPEADQTYSKNRSSTLPARKKLSDATSPVNVGRWPPLNERPAEKSRIEDTQILQRLMKDNVANVDTSPSVKSRIANIEGGTKQASPRAAGQQRPLFHQQRSFSQGRIDIQPQPLKEPQITQSSSMDSLLDTRPPTRIGSSSASTEQRRSPIQSDTRQTKRWETVDYTPREPLERTGDNFKRPSPNAYSVTNNTGTQEPRRDIEPTSPLRLERQRSFEEEPYRKFESSARVENKVNSAMERTAPANDNRGLLITNILESDLKRKPPEEKPPPPSTDNDDNEVFWDADESLPPPPPMDAFDPLETSHDSLPLPSPPREVIVEFPSSNNDNNSRQKNAVPKETFQQNGEDNSDIIKPEETVVVESGVEINREPKIELNGPGKVDTSGVSDQPFETSSSTDLSSKETSPAESKTKSYKTPPPAPLIITSTPTNDEADERGLSLDVSTSPYSVGSNTSTPSSSRPNSMLSPKLEALDKEKADLVGSMKQKIIDLRSQMDEIKDEIDGNEELGRKVTKVVERKATAAEFSKYQLFTGELNKIIGLLLILTQRMHRYEMMLNDLDMSEEADRQQRDILQEKIEKVTMQHEEACKIKEVNDKRGEVVSKILENCLEEEEFADFQYYIDMKTQLALMHAEIRDKVKMGEERLNTLHSTKIDWSILSLT